MDEIRKQAQRCGAESRFENIVSVDFSVRPFLLRTASAEYSADAVIVATGSEVSLALDAAVQVKRHKQFPMRLKDSIQGLFTGGRKRR